MLCSTIGGTATLVGDPPNIVIGSKLHVSFTDFILHNSPLVMLLLPLSSFILYHRFKHELRPGKCEVDVVAMKEKFKLHDHSMLVKVAAVGTGIILALFLTPLHGQEAAWFTFCPPPPQGVETVKAPCMPSTADRRSMLRLCGGAGRSPVAGRRAPARTVGMLAMSLLLATHSLHDLLKAVEWDTLLFFASLFVLVECLGELGVIRFAGGMLADLIIGFPLDDYTTPDAEPTGLLLLDAGGGGGGGEADEATIQVGAALSDRSTVTRGTVTWC